MANLADWSRASTMEPAVARDVGAELPRNGGDDRCEGQDEVLDIAARDVTIDSGILPPFTLLHYNYTCTVCMLQYVYHKCISLTSTTWIYATTCNI